MSSMFQSCAKRAAAADGSCSTVEEGDRHSGGGGFIQNVLDGHQRSLVVEAPFFLA